MLHQWKLRVEAGASYRGEAVLPANAPQGARRWDVYNSDGSLIAWAKDEEQLYRRLLAHKEDLETAGG